MTFYICDYIYVHTALYFIFTHACIYVCIYYSGREREREREGRGGGGCLRWFGFEVEAPFLPH
jgi:hypothetical protein